MSNFLLKLLFTTALALTAGAAETTQPILELQSLSPPVLLPDGREFKTWEKPLSFSRTYYVDGSAPNASDNNPGSKEAPFASINKAAQVLQLGERVIVAAGVYRERIKPARGGTGPMKMISYEAAPGAKVILKGSRVFKADWKPVLNAEQAPITNVWQAPLEGKYFDGYNPFEIENVTPKQFEVMDWATPLRGKAPYTLSRGLIFQDGKLLNQRTNTNDLATKPGSYWVDHQTILVHPFDEADPRGASFEITTQETLLAPDQMGLGFIRVKGFILEHVAGPWPWEQVGAISTTRGHHWIIEENTIRWVNGVGMDLGIQHPRWPRPEVVGYHIVRRNTVSDCGICGICGLGPGNKDFGLLIEDNVLMRNSFFDVERLFELAAIKTHNNVRCLIRRNLILDTQHGAGIWMDWNNQFSRCMQNVIVGSKTLHGGIFVEASYEPNLIDHNFIWATDGHGIYEHDSCNQIFVHNFIGQSAKSALLLNGKVTNRRISGREIVGGRHTVRNNVFVSNQKTNLYRGEPSEVADNLSENVTASFDVSKVELTWSVTDGNTTCQPVKWITHDFLGQPRPKTAVVPGLFNTMPSTPLALKLWPVD